MTRLRLAAVGLAAALLQAPTADSAPRERTRSGPIECSGIERLRLVDHDIRADGIALSVSGGCRVVIERSHIRAGGAALEVSGAGRVDVIDSEVSGKVAVRISGVAVVRATGTRFVGGRDVTGSGTYIDGGKNRWR